MFWARNILFISLCLLGAGGVAANLLRRDTLDQPRTFRPNRFQAASHDENDWSATVVRMNAEFRAHWQAKGLPHSGQADDLTIARRLSLGLTGTVPSLEETRALEAVPAKERIEWWTSRILEDRRYADYLAERLARAYVGTEDGPFLIYRRRRFATWLSDNLAE